MGSVLGRQRRYFSARSLSDRTRGVNSGLDVTKMTRSFAVIVSPFSGRDVEQSAAPPLVQRRRRGEVRQSSWLAGTAVLDFRHMAKQLGWRFPSTLSPAGWTKLPEPPAEVLNPGDAPSGNTCWNVIVVAR